MSDFELPKSNTQTRPRKRAVEKSSVEDVAFEHSTVPVPDVSFEDIPTTEDDSVTDSPKYSPEELAAIFDELIFTGEYTEEVLIKGKLRISFRTRSAGDIETISKVLDASNTNLVATLSEKRSLMNLQYSLAFYNGRDLRTLKVEERSVFISRLPAPIVASLFIALADFDAKVYAACKEAEANF